jgi:hypothetical protein
MRPRHRRIPDGHEPAAPVMLGGEAGHLNVCDPAAFAGRAEYGGRAPPPRPLRNKFCTGGARVSARGLRPHRSSGHVREVDKPTDLPLDGRLQALCRCVLLPFEIFINRFKVRTRSERIPDLHPLLRLKNSAISSSVTNSPRLACALPSRTAMRVSSSRWTGSAHFDTSESRISAASS